jgi:hypothetical protein
MVDICYQSLVISLLCGTIVPLTTGYLPIPFEAKIVYDNHSLSNETQSLLGSGIMLMVRMA